MSDEVRVNDCLHGFCKERTEECRRCDGVVTVLKRHLRRMPPDAGLQPPKMAFEDTFSGEEVVMQTFFGSKKATP